MSEFLLNYLILISLSAIIILSILASFAFLNLQALDIEKEKNYKSGISLLITVGVK
jgi:hypothetical protein